MYWSQISILFSDNEKRSGIRGLQGADIVAFSLLLEELVKGIALMLWHGVEFAIYRAWSIWEEIDSMVPFPRWGESSRCLFAKYLLVAKVFWGHDLFESWLSFLGCLLS